jgi:prepilin-type N-terminal cleavage/methylation domain-containing protein
MISLRRDNTSGFTLIELMIVMALMGLLVAIGAPRFEALNRINRLKTGVRQVAISIQNARLTAISANRRCYMDFALGTLTPADSFFTVWLDVNGDQMYDNGEIDSTRIGLPDTKDGYQGMKLPRGVAFGAGNASSGPDGMALVSDGVDFDGTDLLGFNARGEGTTGVIYLKAEDGTTFAITVSRMGRVRTWQWGDNQWK